MDHRLGPGTSGPTEISRIPSAWRNLRSLALAALGTVSMCLFIALADGAVDNDDLSAFDPAVTSWAVASRHSAATSVAWIFTHLGGTLGLIILTALTACALVLRRRRTHATVLVLAMMSSSLATVILKLAFGRSRPSVDLLLGEVSHSYAFPSGHSFNTAVFAGTLAGFVVFSTAGRSSKIAATLVALAVTITVGLSRIYLAYHWLTDVLGGWALGVSWLCGCALLTVRVLERRRARASAGPRPTGAVTGPSRPSGEAQR